MADNGRPASAPLPSAVHHRELPSKSLSTSAVDDAHGVFSVQTEGRARKSSSTTEDEESLSIKRTAKTTHVLTQPHSILITTPPVQQKPSSKKVIKWLFLPPLDDDDDYSSRSSSSSISTSSSPSKLGIKLKRATKPGHVQECEADENKTCGKGMDAVSGPSAPKQGTTASGSSISITLPRSPTEAASISRVILPPGPANFTPGPSTAVPNVKSQASAVLGGAATVTKPESSSATQTGGTGKTEFVSPTSSASISQNLQADLERDLLELNRLLSKSAFNNPSKSSRY